MLPSPSLLIEKDLFTETKMSRKMANVCESTKMLLTSLPWEILLLIMEFLDLEDLHDMAMTSSYMNTALGPMLYKHAMAIGVHREKFVYAAAWGRTTAISKFLKAGVSMTEFSSHKLSVTDWRAGDIQRQREASTMEIHPLLAAALFGHVDVVRTLITEGNVDVDFEDCTQNTALLEAIRNTRADIVELLVTHGARLITESDNNNEDDFHHSPFLLAAFLGNRDALEIMYSELQNRSIPKQTMMDLCHRACVCASQYRYTDIVRFFLVKGVSVNSIRRNGCHALYYASVGANFPMIKLLLKYGAKMENEADTGVVSAIYYADSSSEAKDVVKHLIKSGCNVANGQRHACALWSIVRGYWNGWTGPDQELIELLRKSGFDKRNCRDNCWIKGGYCFKKEYFFTDAFFDYIKGQSPDA